MIWWINYRLCFNDLDLVRVCPDLCSGLYKTERQKDRKTERQKDRETERQDIHFNYQFVTNISVKKYKKVPEQFIYKKLKKSVQHFPNVYKKHDAVEKLLQIFKIERKHPESKLYYQVIGSFVGTGNTDITHGNDFLNAISEYYNTDLYNIPEKSYPIPFYNINMNHNYFFYVYRFTYYDTYNEIVQIDINEYYLL